MKILIVKLSAFGDIIHALPALDDLLTRTKVSAVHWLVDARYAFVANVFPPQVIVHTVDLKHPRGLRHLLHHIRELRRQHFDAVLDLQGLIKSGLMARLTGSPVFGMDPRYAREKANRCFVRPVRFHADERHVVQQSRRIAAAPFARRPEASPQHAMPYKPPRVMLTSAMREAGEKVLRQWHLDPGGFVWLHMGGGWATKQLPEATWAEVAQGLMTEGITPVAGWGNTHERTVAQSVMRRIGAGILPDRRLEMPTLCGLLAQARAVVGPDTGVIHLAAALGTPVISFWGPSASWRSAPLDGTNRQVESGPPCGPCFKRTCNRFICMDMIRSSDILAGIHAGFSPS